MGDKFRGKKILFFGFGYTAKRLYELMAVDGWVGYATYRNRKYKISKTHNIQYLDFICERQELETLILSSDAILISIPPEGMSDPVLNSYKEPFKQKLDVSWIGYLSATSVYGDYKGAWINEESKPVPKTSRGINRLFVEDQWRELGTSFTLPIIRFRISGIYGPGRDPFMRIKNGTQKIIQKENQFFNRIHIDDLCEILYKSIKEPTPGEVFNISDNDPSTPEDFINEATKLLGVPRVAKVDIKKAGLSDIARSFYADSKKVSSQKIVKKLKYKFRYSSYKDGLKSIIEEEN